MIKIHTKACGFFFAFYFFLCQKKITFTHKNNMSEHLIWQNIRLLREKSPLVHSITNQVVSNFNANVLLAVGASPIMAHAEEELQDLLNIAQALVLNIGTLDMPQISAMKKAQTLAMQQNLPIVLDPVGAGASALRTQTALHILKTGVSVLRANASEVLALAGESAQTKGVDSTADSKNALQSAHTLAKTYHTTVCMSGAVDYVVTEAGVVCALHNGQSMMTKITGMGCSASALVGAFLAVEENPALASASAMALMGIAGDIAAKEAKGVGSFAVSFLDVLGNLDKETFFKHIKIDNQSIS
jgi:hydroxyethylthiazole kinase